MNQARTTKVSIEGWLTLSASLLVLALVGFWSAGYAAAGRGNGERTDGGGWGVLESAAMANPMVSHVGGITMLTTDGGTDEILVVLDNRTEMLMVYRVDNSSAVELLQRTPVGAMFTDARIKASGK